MFSWRATYTVYVVEQKEDWGRDIMEEEMKNTGKHSLFSQLSLSAVKML